MIRHQPHKQLSAHANHPPTFTIKRRRPVGFETTPYIKASIVVSIALDSSDPQTDSTSTVSPAKTTAITPSSVKVTILGPRKLKVIAPLSETLVSRPIQNKPLDVLTIRIRLPFLILSKRQFSDKREYTK
jgi:hypothetical protein|tara:strand:- start:43 stop:432 length:390 start_codon:yes stop_codon:yes gene_type:complete